MQVKISRCVAVDLAYKPRADANHFTIACACQRTASVRLSIAVLVSTWLIIAAASSVLPARCRRSQSSAAVLDLIAGFDRRILLTLGETGEGGALTFRETVLAETVLALNAKCSRNSRCLLTLPGTTVRLATRPRGSARRP